MLGSCFLKRLSGSEDFEMYVFDEKDLDITDHEALVAIFERISPDFVINCAAYTDVDGCEENRDMAFKVNGEAVGELAKVCKQENAILVHFSTDYVFDGAEASGYEEDDEPSPINVYGESKLAGEKAVAQNMSDYYLVRTSWLFGENGTNFVDSMVELGRSEHKVDVVNDQIGSPTYTNDLCDAVIKHFLYPYTAALPEHHKRLFDEKKEKPSKKLPFGTYHLTNSGKCSWAEFAKEIFEVKGLGVEVNEVSSEDFARPAKRPAYSILLNTKIEGKLRSWKEAVKAYLQ